MRFDWPAFESSLQDELLHAYRQTLEGGGPVYAIALHGIYRELDYVISLPIAAAALAEGAPPGDEGGFHGVRWNPADWAHPDIALRQPTAEALRDAITREATRGSQAHFRRVEARYMRVIVRVTRRLRDALPRHVPVTDDFVAFVHDEDGGAALAARTIPKRRYEALFAPQVERAAERARVRAMPEAERAALLVDRLRGSAGREEAGRELLAIGPAAVPALLAVVHDAEMGWDAARLLAGIGEATDAVIAALRARAAESRWHAMALGALGDHEWLAAQPTAVAVQGLCAPLRRITGARGPLRYAPLEAYLDGAPDEVREAVEEVLEVGSGLGTITVDDLPEALRGLRSPHAVIRWHAAGALWDRGLGRRAGRLALPALVEALADPHPLVRRIAILSIEAWKADAAPHLPAIEPLRDDPDPTVRAVAGMVLDGGN